MNINTALHQASKELKIHKIDAPTKLARILLADTLKYKKEDLIINGNMEIEEGILNTYFHGIKELCNNIPLQYITKKQEFMGDVFEVNEDVLIPRYDTEVLVEEALKYTKGNILDLCTGSGIIAISIAKRCKQTKITAVDISEPALKVAKENAKKHNVNINFICSNLFENINEKYDLIVSNPPYIETNTIAMLDENVKKEPIIALDGGEDGLNFYRIIAENAYKYLNSGAYLCLEIGYNQKESVINLLKDKYNDIKCVKDLAGNDRVIVCRREEL